MVVLGSAARSRRTTLSLDAFFYLDIVGVVALVVLLLLIVYPQRAAQESR
jgi:hypothetical protein